MANDREDIVRRAEKLLRQGKLDAAIQEYARLLEEQPNDWNTRNVLGDLYVRANQVDQAVAQFTQIADHFAREGFLPRAIALYKKVVKIKPSDEHALLQSAEINAKQGLLADAKTALAAIADKRRRNGDSTGANDILIRIATLDPADLSARLAAARATADAGDPVGAAVRYKELASELFIRDRAPEAVEALAEALRLDPSDDAARNSLVAAYLNGGVLEEARRWATTGGHFRALADCLSARGKHDDAMDALFEAVQRDPADVATRTHLARTLIERGDIERAMACVQPEDGGDNPDLLLLAAELEVRAGSSEAAYERLRNVIAREPARRSDVVRIGCGVAVTDKDLAFRFVEIAADAAAAAQDWRGAAACLQEYLAHVPMHIPALIKLVDVCVDGDVDDVLAGAQGDLAEAYLSAGRAFEARVIAEDLLTRAPEDPSSIDRFRRALVMLGEHDPDAIIAERLNPDPVLAIDDLNADLPEPQPPQPAAGPKVLPFTRSAEPQEAATPHPAGEGEPSKATRVASGGTADRGSGAARLEDLPGEWASETVAGDGAGEPATGVAARSASAHEMPERGGPGEKRTRGGDSEEAATLDLDATSLDLDAILGGDDKGLEIEDETASDFVEIDLSSALTDIGSASPPPPAPAARAASAPESGLDDVFDDLRQEVANEQATNTAAQHYKLAVTYHDMGMTDECIKALQVAARSPRYRFQAASLLGRIHRNGGRTHDAIDWFERAAESPAPGVDAGRALLYELGQALEDEGESVRALAVYLELQADAGDYRDVAARVKRLSR